MSILGLVKNLLGGGSSSSGLSNAYLEVYGESGTTKINCLFNPSSYNIRRTVEYRPIRALGSDLELTQFSRCNASVLSVSLFFDSLMETEGDSDEERENKAKPVTDYTKPITALTHIDGKLHRPDRVGFVWGNLNFVGVVVSASEEFLMFNKSGKPLREKIDLTIESIKTSSMGSKESPFESPDRTKYIRFSEDMSLWQLAYKEYGDCSKWKLIARENDISDPLSIEAGRLLKIPAI